MMKENGHNRRRLSIFSNDERVNSPFDPIRIKHNDMFISNLSLDFAQRDNFYG